jgi:hypothetical protein
VKGATMRKTYSTFYGIIRHINGLMYIQIPDKIKKDFEFGSEDVAKVKQSYTAQFLNKELSSSHN